MSSLDPIEPEAAVSLYLDHRRDEVSEETLSSHRYRLGAFVEWCEQENIYNMNDVSGRDLHAYRVHRRTEHELRPMTLQGQLSTLRVFLRFCASIDAVEDDTASKVLLPTVRGEDQARETLLAEDRAEEILEYLQKFHYGSRAHVLFCLFWYTGMRTGGARAIDLDDYDSEDNAIELVHRPEEDTPLKNGTGGERFIALSSSLTEILDDYIGGPRIEIEDEYGREPLLTTTQGRPATGTIRDIVYHWTRPCYIGRECPHDRDPEECDAANGGAPTGCPSVRSPHDIRSGAITSHLLEDVPVEVVSDRMDVSQDVLDRHYDRRTEREKMEQRREYLWD